MLFKYSSCIHCMNIQNMAKSNIKYTQKKKMETGKILLKFLLFLGRHHLFVYHFSQVFNCTHSQISLHNLRLFYTFTNLITHLDIILHIHKSHDKHTDWDSFVNSFATIMAPYCRFTSGDWGGHWSLLNSLSHETKLRLLLCDMEHCPAESSH